MVLPERHQKDKPVFNEGPERWFLILRSVFKTIFLRRRVSIFFFCDLVSLWNVQCICTQIYLFILKIYNAYKYTVTCWFNHLRIIWRCNDLEYIDYASNCIADGRGLRGGNMTFGPLLLYTGATWIISFTSRSWLVDSSLTKALFIFIILTEILFFFCRATKRAVTTWKALQNRVE